MRIRSVVAIRHLVVLLAAGVGLSGCKGLKDALTAHTDLVARTVNQDLTATRLGTQLGTARIGIDASAQNARIIADLWVDYQRLGYAAAHHDSMSSAVTATIQPLIDNMRVSMMIDTLRSKIKIDTTDAEAGYNAAVGGIIGARHILFGFPSATKTPPAPVTPAEKDSVRTFAAKILPQINNANFAAMAKKYSSDPGSKDRGGDYGLFARDKMVPEFSNAVIGVKPGQITGLVESQFGIHVIQRLPYSEVKTQYAPGFAQVAQIGVDSTISANLTAKGQVTVKDNAAAPIKEAVKNPDAHHKDKTVLATFKGGEMNVGQFLAWVDVMPINLRQQVAQIVPTWPDSQVKSFAKNMAMRQMLLHQADSAKLDVSATEKATLVTQFGQLVQNAWQQLGVTPKALADSAKSERDRERIAAAHVDTLMNRILNGEAQPFNVPIPLKSALDSKWEATINSTGIDRAVEVAKKARASADSARATQAPPQMPSQVPMPGMQNPPAAAPPATKTPPPTKKKP
jgi:PPIC-type PPIASE domain